MDFLRQLNDVQQEAVKKVEGPVMIIAGAGSGKTRVLTYRIAYLLAAGVPSYQILALTFTNKAANEMKSRVKNLVGASAEQLWMGTFHSIFARILRKESSRLGYSNNFSIYDTDDSLSVVKKSMSKLNISTQMIHPNAVRSKISLAKNQYLSPADVEQRARDRMEELVASIYKEYELHLRENNAMDFDDLLVKPIVLFQRFPEVLNKYQQRFKFLLVDEFQDTNLAQYKMVQYLAQEHENIAVVGDDAQSIYSFRGADIRNILNFEKDYPDCAVFRLEQNYRSTKIIISVADKLIHYNTEQLRKQLWTANPQGDPVTVIQCTDEQDEGIQIVRALQRESQKKKLDLKDFAVLYRTNAQSRSLEDAFRKNGIPYVIVGGVRFYERKEIKDLLAYFRVLANPRDEESLLRIINYPPRGIGDTTLSYLQQYGAEHGIPLTDVLSTRLDDVQNLTDRAKNALVQFRNFLNKYSALRSTMSLGEWSRVLVDELGILQMFKEEQTPDALSRWENVQELLSAISEYEAEHPDGTLESFLEEVSLVSDIDMWEGGHNAVTLMTLHASKGLEFPVVFIAGLEEGLLPFYNSPIENADLEEERRLFYVGITRAQQKLYITYTRLRYRFGDVSYPQPSRFLYELGNENIEQVHTHLQNVPHTGNLFHDNGKKKSARRSFANDSIEHFDEMPSYEQESQVEWKLKRGGFVRHEVFGKGKILEISGKGEMQKVVVYFEQYGTKQLFVKYANLRPA
jgi:DNA helicase-2/ATP-dependent DNA helicase PcrA